MPYCITGLLALLYHWAAGRRAVGCTGVCLHVQILGLNFHEGDRCCGCELVFQPCLLYMLFAV